MFNKHETSQFVAFVSNIDPGFMELTGWSSLVTKRGITSSWRPQETRSTSQEDFGNSPAAETNTIFWSQIGCHMYKTISNWWFEPLWKIWVRQLGLLFHVYIYIWKFIKFMFQTTKQLSGLMLRNIISMLQVKSKDWCVISRCSYVVKACFFCFEVIPIFGIHR